MKRRVFSNTTDKLSFEIMAKTIHAVFENGVFRPVSPVDLPENAEVEFEPRVIHKKDGWPDGYFESTAGAFENEPFERPKQGSLPNRGNW
ncbi:MAG: antitoxin family protein [Pirellulaceae bacterium]|jgi:predicted DNA-binding antitoxin AbrB/MazE fold protein